LRAFINEEYRGKVKTDSTKDTYRNAFKTFFKRTGILPENFVEGKFDGATAVDAYKAAKGTANAKLCSLKHIDSFLKRKEIPGPEITRYVTLLFAEDKLQQGQPRSKEEHDKTYVDIDIAKVIAAVDEMMAPGGEFSLLYYLQLLAIYMEWIVPDRPSELVSTSFHPDAPNRINLDEKKLYILEQKSKGVGERIVDLPDHLVNFIASNRAKVPTISKGWLFPRYRSLQDAPVSRTDFTRDLIRPITRELFGKSVTSRNVRTNVISKKVPSMSVEDRVDFAQQCGHSIGVQKDHYAVLVSSWGTKFPHTPSSCRSCNAIAGPVSPDKFLLGGPLQSQRSRCQQLKEESPPPPVITNGIFVAEGLSTNAFNRIMQIAKPFVLLPEFSYCSGAWKVRLDLKEHFEVAIELVGNLLYWK
jgi:hypothetical protein